jgi:hypothetical protein
VSAHDWTTWTPASMPNGPRWRLIRFEAVAGDGQPLGKCIECTSPGGGVRTFPTEAAAQGAADWLNANPEGAGDA